MLVVGSGRAEKIQVQKKIKTFFNLKKMPKSDDAADALAIALAHVFIKRARGLDKLLASPIMPVETKKVVMN